MCWTKHHFHSSHVTERLLACVVYSGLHTGWKQSLVVTDLADSTCCFDSSTFNTLLWLHCTRKLMVPLTESHMGVMVLNKPFWSVLWVWDRIYIKNMDTLSQHAICQLIQCPIYKDSVSNLFHCLTAHVFSSSDIAEFVAEEGEEGQGNTLFWNTMQYVHMMLMLYNSSQKEKISLSKLHLLLERLLLAIHSQIRNMLYWSQIWWPGRLLKFTVLIAMSMKPVWDWRTFTSWYAALSCWK